MIRDLNRFSFRFLSIQHCNLSFSAPLMLTTIAYALAPHALFKVSKGCLAPFQHKFSAVDVISFVAVMPVYTYIHRF